MIEYIPWGHMQPDNSFLMEDGTTEELRTADVRFVLGKHKDLLLSDCHDVGYMKWMLDIKKDDHFVQLAINKRLLELV